MRKGRNKRLLTADEVAVQLRLKPQTVRKYICQNLLRPSFEGGLIFISQSSLDEFRASGRQPKRGRPKKSEPKPIRSHNSPWIEAKVKAMPSKSVPDVDFGPEWD